MYYINIAGVGGFLKIKMVTKLLFFLKKKLGQYFFKLPQNSAWPKVFCVRERGLGLSRASANMATEQTP